MEISSVIAAAKVYVTQQFEQRPDPVLVYHNMAHTQQVVQAAEQIAAYYRLTDADHLVVLLAAWFHDVGYILGARAEHEQAGANAAREFIALQQLPESVALAVEGCILATRIPQAPNNLLEQIVCDADLFHLGSKEFSKRNKLLRAEAELAGKQEISGLEWTISTINFLEAHKYHTAYSQTLLKQQKEENLERLKAKLEKKQGEAIQEAVAEQKKLDKKAAKQEKKKEESKPERPEVEKQEKLGRGVETMFRTTSTNHIRLSSMADSKANIMISVNAIIISVLLSVLLRKLEDYPNFILPSIIFLTTSVTTIVFSILATRPNVTSGRFTLQDIQHKKSNLLFFGNFHQMSYQEYEDGMETIMKKNDYLYSNMIHDIYNLGVVLGRKYRMLRIAYNIFMFGIIASVLAFTIAALFFPVKG
ncbi:HD domain-containing protein [Chitinophaga sp. SYP-B3965]|uniref:Pycsar system effector family protein n=1 Tax=Chitinophaga sp. SYP-B3965 TaxID=2663120 RepID=UPI001299DA91|nr:Pycsar system effector family protein [Chitinophaga sp. SYP-B3965]MRG47893.1 HD domain-containing protein [Chitinophaga sp. SYP-B3965]